MTKGVKKSRKKTQAKRIMKYVSNRHCSFWDPNELTWKPPDVDLV